jgi:phospholipid N-methyltransferase
MWKEVQTFWQATFASFDSVGAIAPSSQALAQAITQQVSQKKGRVRVLEVGAGTGVFTRKLIEILAVEDHLDICELHPPFIQYLQELTTTSPAFINFKGTFRLLPMPVQNISGAAQYDYIVSGLPLNAFEPQLVEDILTHLLKLLKPNGWISYFEYIGVRRLKMVLSFGKDEQRIHGVNHIVTHFIRRYEMYHIPVWHNLPPAYARHCQKRILRRRKI